MQKLAWCVKQASPDFSNENCSVTKTKSIGFVQKLLLKAPHSFVHRIAPGQINTRTHPQLENIDKITVTNKGPEPISPFLLNQQCVSMRSSILVIKTDSVARAVL